jgi:hypothetical protein
MALASLIAATAPSQFRPIRQVNGTLACESLVAAIAPLQCLPTPSKGHSANVFTSLLHGASKSTDDTLSVLELLPNEPSCYSH